MSSINKLTKWLQFIIVKFLWALTFDSRIIASGNPGIAEDSSRAFIGVLTFWVPNAFEVLKRTIMWKTHSCSSGQFYKIVMLFIQLKFGNQTCGLINASRHSFHRSEILETKNLGLKHWSIKCFIFCSLLFSNEIQWTLHVPIRYLSDGRQYRKNQGTQSCSYVLKRYIK